MESHYKAGRSVMGSTIQPRCIRFEMNKGRSFIFGSMRSGIPRPSSCSTVECTREPGDDPHLCKNSRRNHAYPVGENGPQRNCSVQRGQTRICAWEEALTND